MRAEKTKNSSKDTLVELYVGIGVCGGAFQLSFMWFFSDKWYFTIGLWAGVMIAAAMAWHMWKALDTGLDMGVGGAVKHIRIQSVIRYGAVAFVLALLCITKAGNPVSAFLGLMTLKAAAYLQPLTHKAILKLRR